VFTTLHTNSAAASFVRLDEMGIAPYLVGTATICVLAQRLARRVCDGCKVEKPVDPELLASLGIAPGALTRQWEGAGCERCRHLGYKGRVGIFEVMPIDDELRALITKRASASTVHAAAVAKGMLDLPRYGLWLVENGITTLAEVARCVSFDLEMTPEDDHEAPITKREPEGAARVGPDPAHPSHGHRAAHAGATHD
jgi:type II secretory ATPase GspE/PulE/Tfp pilus assembly ATPase PilB-like protein